MRIIKVEAIPVRCELSEPFGFAQGWYSKREAVICQIITDEGLTGFGETFGPSAGQLDLLEKFFRPLLIGENPMNIEFLWRKMYFAARRAFQSFIPMSVIGALDMALWDIKGKVLEAPVFTLLGGPTRETVTAYVTGHYFLRRSIEDVIKNVTEEAQRHVSEGFQALKLKLGLKVLGGDIRDDVKLVNSVRKSVGPEITLMVDANYGYTVWEAIKVGKELDNLAVLWFEEPIDPFDFDGYCILREKLNLMLATGECFAEYRQFDQIVDKRCIDVLQPDLSASGGITQVKKIADLALVNGLWFVPHVWGTGISMAAALQVIGSHPGYSLLEFDRSPFPMREEFIKENIRRAGSEVVIPSSPGLGIKIEDGWLRKYKYEGR